MDNQEQFLPAMVSRSQGAVRDEGRGGATGGRGCHAHGRGRRTRVPSDPDVGATEATRTTWTRPAVQVLKEVVGDGFDGPVQGSYQAGEGGHRGGRGRIARAGFVSS